MKKALKTVSSSVAILPIKFLNTDEFVLYLYNQIGLRERQTDESETILLPGNQFL